MLDTGRARDLQRARRATTIRAHTLAVVFDSTVGAYRADCGCGARRHAGTEQGARDAHDIHLTVELMASDLEAIADVRHAALAARAANTAVRQHENRDAVAEGCLVPTRSRSGIVRWVAA